MLFGCPKNVNFQNKSHEPNKFITLISLKIQLRLIVLMKNNV